MVVVPLSKPVDDPENTPEAGAHACDAMNMVRFAAAGTLVAGGALLLTGNRRTGMLAAAAGTALTMLDQQETLRHWWNALPGYLDQAQALLTRMQGAVDDVTVQQEKLRKVFARTS